MWFSSVIRQKIRNEKFLITIELTRNSKAISLIFNCVIFIRHFNNVTLTFFDIIDTNTCKGP